MPKTVTHQQIFKESVFGGILNTTLCGRMSHTDDDGMNVGDAVTCKLCLKINANPNHWRFKNAWSWKDKKEAHD